MKTEDGSEALHPWIEPELEARLTALVLGEASDFERDELERLVADRPELALYRKRLEAMHRMLREVAKGESTGEQGEWKLGAERRASLLAQLSGKSPSEDTEVPPATKRSPWSISSRFLAVAATIVFVGLMLGVMFPASTGVLRSKGGKSQWYDDAYAYETSGHDRERMRRAVDEGWESPAPADAPFDTDGEAREMTLADRAIRTPEPTSATPAPPAEPMVVTRSGQIAASTGTAAIGAGGDIALGVDPNSPGKLSVDGFEASGQVRVGGDFDGRNVGGRTLAGEPVTSTMSGVNTYTGGVEISAGGGALAIPNPEPPAAAPPTPASPTPAEPEMQRGLRDETVGSIGAKAKTQVGVSLVEAHKTKAVDILEQNTGNATLAEVPAAGHRQQARKDLDADSDRYEAEEKPLMESAKRASDDFGTLALNQSGAAPVASPKPVSAAPVSGPSVADPETRLTKSGAGTLALNGGTVDLGLSQEVVEVDGFIDHKQKTDAPANGPAAGGNLNFTGDLQVNGGVEAKINAAKESLSLGSGGVIADASKKEPSEGFGFEAPVKLDALSRAAGGGGGAAQEGDVSRFGLSVAVEKSLSQATESEVRRESTGDWGKAPVGKAPIDETVGLGGEISAGYMSDYIYYGTRFQADGKNVAVPTPGTVNFGTAVSQVENLGELPKSGDANVALPGLQSDKKTFRFSVRAGSPRKDAEVTIDEPWLFRRAGEVDQSVADIMALTPQVGTAVDPEQLLRQVVPRIVGGGSVPTNPNVPAEANAAWYNSADSSVPAVDKTRFATFYDAGDVTDGTTAANSDWGIGTNLFVLGSSPVKLDYAAPLDESKLTSEGRFQFTMGASFGDETEAKAEKSANRPTPRQPTPAALAETSPAAEPFSTFSLHVSDVSFQLAKAALASGKWPEAEKIRIEEFVNAFDYGDPIPAMDERVACRIDQAAHPFLQQRHLVRIALRTAEVGRSSGTPLRLTLLLDSSGSMERPDRRETLTRAVTTLAGLLGENDRITLVSFARQPRLVADAVPGNEAMKLAETVAALPSEGGTNLEAALQLAFEKAREHQEPNAQNRIVLLTDGAANLGDAKAESLGQRVELMREAGIAFDAAGFGAEGLNDEILEALTRKGDGRYYLLDRPEDADDAFAKQIAGALRPAAKNVKVQVEFNPDRVKSYKLLGFEKHRLATEDFRNDAVDAAEMAAAEAGVAVYQVEPIPGGEGDLGSVSVRFRDLDSGEMVERRWGLAHLPAAPSAEQGGDAILLATVASQFAAKLAGGPLGDVVDLGELARLAAELPESERVKELRTMIEQARGLEGTSTNF